MKRINGNGCAVILLGIILAACASSPQARSDKFLARGKALLEKRDYARAILEFSNAAKAMPSNAEPYYYYGVTAMEIGDLQKAYNSFRKAAELNPNHLKARLRIAQLMTMGGEAIVKEAEKDLEELIQITPATPEMLNSLAVTQLKLGKVDDAVRVLEDSVTQSPGELASSILLARAKLLQKDVPGAEEVLRRACEASPKAPAPQLALAALYTALKKENEAEQAIQRALQLDPKNVAAIRDLAFLQNRTGKKKEAEEGFKKLAATDEETVRPLYALFLFSESRRDEAVRELERLAKKDPQDRRVRTMLVMAYQASDRPADARRVLDEALKKNRRDLEALLQRGQMLTADGKYPEAEADLTEVVKQKPDLAAGRYAMAKLHQAQGRPLQYREELFKVLELDPMLLDVRVELAGDLITNKSPKDARNLLDQTPDPQKNSAAVLAQRNWALWSSGDFQEMRKGIDLGLSNARSGEFLVQDGLWKLHAGDANAARASLEEALKMNPADIRALAGLKDAYLRLKQAPRAVQKVKEYASQQPKSAAAQEFLGYTMWGNGDRAAARAAFTAAKAADPKFASADLALVQLDALESNWGDAANRLNTLLVSDPSNATAHLWLGNIETIRGNLAVALDHFRKVVETEPDNPQALNNFAYLLADQKNNLEEALKYAQRAQELAPNDPSFEDTLGWILCRKGMYPPAIKYLERAAAGQDAVAKYHLAMAYARNGNLEQGRAMYRAALKRNPNLPEAKIAEGEVLKSK